MSQQHAPQPPVEPGERRVRSDALAVIVMSTLAAAATIFLTVRTFRAVFQPNGIAWTLPVEPESATATGVGVIRSGTSTPGEAVSGTIEQLHVIVADVNTVSVVCLGTAILLAGVAALVVIACTARLAWAFLRGHFFTRDARRALQTLAWSALLGGAAALFLWHMGGNGVEAALGVQARVVGLEWWAWYALALFVIVAFGLVDIALRRAARLQADTEGLV